MLSWKLETLIIIITIIIIIVIIMMLEIRVYIKVRDFH